MACEEEEEEEEDPLTIKTMPSANSPILDPSGKTISINLEGMVRVDGIIAFRIVTRKNKVCIQFCDQDRLRSSCRGTRYVEIPLDTLANRLTNGK